MMSEKEPITVVETPEFLSVTKKLMDAGERAALVDFLALNPESGDLIRGTGGVRKVRWALKGRGKSGGARVIYFYHDKGMPLFALTIYAKNERANLSAGDCSEMKKLTAFLVAQYKGMRRKS